MLRRVSLLILLPFAAITGCSGDDDLVTPEDTGADSTTVDVAPDTFAPDTEIDSTTEETSLPDTPTPDTSDSSMGDSSETSMGDSSETSMGDSSETSMGDSSETSMGDSSETSMGDSPEAATDTPAEASDATDAVAPLPEPEVWVVRVGEDTKDVDSSAAKVQIERIRLSDRMKIGTIDFPVSPTADGGASSTFTLTGESVESEGSLTRSMDGHFVTLVGYLAPIGTSAVVHADGGMLPRVVARIDATATVDMSTRTTSFSNEDVDAVLTANGTSYWISSHNNIRTIAHGASGPASAPLVVSDAGASSGGARALAGWAGQIFGTEPGVFEVTPPTRVPLLPMSSSESYDGIVVSPTSGTPADAFYVCDLFGNIDRWTKSSGSPWSKSATFAIPSPDGTSTVGCTSLTAGIVAGKVTLVASTYELAPRLVTVVDDGTAPAVVSVLATSTERRPYRGVAFAPNP